MKKTVVLGLSGGVDSLVSALLLIEKGYRVIACSFKLWNNESSLENARALAQKIDIEFRIIDISSAFKNKIIDPFVADYISGNTPNPCVWCNNEIKVYYLYQEMINSKADFFATGHYVQLKEFRGQNYIFKGIDPFKDQSYFLWNVQAKYLKYWLTPLGKYKKTDIKKIAIDHKMGFLAHKKESMGICFIGEDGYHNFLNKNKLPNQRIEGGNIIDKDNNVLGKHKGVSYYTVGQKKGLNLKDKKKTVLEIDAKTKTIKVGYDKDLLVSSFGIRDYYFIDYKDTNVPELKVWVRGIGRNPEGFCSVERSGNLLKVELEGEAWALANGQPVAFYIGERLVGGGYIYKLNGLAY